MVDDAKMMLNEEEEVISYVRVTDFSFESILRRKYASNTH